MSEILVGEYLFRRVKELGIDTVFGVPGDYELALLDLIPGQGLTWLGTPNELVGGYAADGYARVKGVAALVTTFGPGELSAVCAIGGSFCEFVPVLHIVGYPTLAAQASGKMLHHTLGDKNYEHYVKIANELCCATTVLKDTFSAAAEIDRVIKTMLHTSRPAYIGIPLDFAYVKIPSAPLNSPLSLSIESNSASQSQLVDKIVERLTAAARPALIVDGGAGRHSWMDRLPALIDALKSPVYVTTMGKGAVDESIPNFGGVYVGRGSEPAVIKGVESADCVIWLGNMPADYNTGVFTEHVDPAIIVEVQRFGVDIGGTKYEAYMPHLLTSLTEAIKAHPAFASRPTPRTLLPLAAVKPSGATEIQHAWLWQRLTPVLRAGDLVVVETGTAQIGITEVRLPRGASMWTQAVYGSIGYAAGAAVGGSVAAKETGKFKRLVLITGEGSLQLTVQAFSLLMRFGVVPLVFVINNGGYTVERFIHGMNASYNNVPMWDYGALFKAFGPEVSAKAFKVSTAAELDALLSDPSFSNADYPQCVDMVMAPSDGPVALKRLRFS